MANKEKLSRTLEFVKTHAEYVEMSLWCALPPSGWSRDIDQVMECGTTGCFALWADLLDGWSVHPEFDGYVISPLGVSHHIEDAAQKVLELTDLETRVLFYCDFDDLDHIVERLLHDEDISDCFYDE